VKSGLTLTRLFILNSFSLDFVVIPLFSRHIIGIIRILFPIPGSTMTLYEVLLPVVAVTRINQESNVIIDRISAAHIIIIIYYISSVTAYALTNMQFFHHDFQRFLLLHLCLHYLLVRVLIALVFGSTVPILS
jgi:hypothetical protein